VSGCAEDMRDMCARTALFWIFTLPPGIMGDFPRKNCPTLQTSMKTKLSEQA